MRGDRIEAQAHGERLVAPVHRQAPGPRQAVQAEYGGNARLVAYPQGGPRRGAQPLQASFAALELPDQELPEVVPGRVRQPAEAHPDRDPVRVQGRVPDELELGIEGVPTVEVENTRKARLPEGRVRQGQARTVPADVEERDAGDPGRSRATNPGSSASL